MIRFVCLGSSASQPTPRSIPSHFALKYGSVFLFDCAEGCQRQMMKYNVPYGSLGAIFLTHLHADHVLGLPGLVQTLNLSGRKEPLMIFGPKGTHAFAESLFSVPNFSASFELVVKEQPSKKAPAFEADLFEVSSYPTDHSCPSVGYVLEEKPKTKFHEEKAKGLGIRGRLFSEILEKKKVTVGGKVIHLEDVTFQQPGKKFVFTGDTAACKGTREAAKGADVLVHDSSFSEKHADKAKLTRHSTAKQAADLAKEADVKKLILTHIGNRYEDRSVLLKEAQAVFPASELAQEGKEWFV